MKVMPSQGRLSFPENTENFYELLIWFTDTLKLFQKCFSTLSKSFYSGHKVNFVFVELLRAVFLIYFEYILERWKKNSARLGKGHLEEEYTVGIIQANPQEAGSSALHYLKKKVELQDTLELLRKLVSESLHDRRWKWGLYDPQYEKVTTGPF